MFVISNLCFAGNPHIRKSSFPLAFNIPVEKDSIYQDGSTMQSFPEKVPVIGFMLSLAVPGAGQRYGGASWLRAGFFAGIDIVGLLAWAKFEQDAERIRLDYEKYADQYWFLDTWMWNSRISKVPGWNEFADVHLIGSHTLYLHLYGEAREKFGEFVSTESIEEIISSFPGVGEDYEYTASVMTVVRDRNFYENIGKYDQFIGGWEDARTAWYAESKKVEKSTETIIMTPRKKYYLKERAENNLLLNYGKYTVSAILFNHILSALDAVYIVGKKNSLLPGNASLNLSFDSRNSFGIGGVVVSFSF